MRSNIPLPFGPGIDRATGMVAVSPASPRDARNLCARDGKVAVTPGMADTGLPPLEWGTDFVKIVGMESTLDVIAVVFDRESRELRLFRWDTENNELQPIEDPTDGIWGTLAEGVEFPVITACEADGQVFFTHAELAIDSRLPTIVYTPDFADPTNVGTFTELTADLDGDGEADVYFYAVVQHLEYVMGVGFGSASDPDRGDILRISLPAQPTVFLAENYAQVGVPKDPVIGMAPAVGALSAFGGITSVLAMGKGNNAYRLIGSSFDDFEVQLLDANHGIIGANAWFGDGKRLFWWSDDGPREVTPASTEPIGQALELMSPLPADFPELGAFRNCFGHWDKLRYLGEFYFPDVVNVSVPVPGFCLSLWDPAKPRWTLREKMQPVICGGYLVTRDSGTPPSPPEGYVSAVLAADAGIGPDTSYRKISLTWDNNAATGSETVQIFAKPDGGDWSQVMSIPVSGASQAATWDTALPVTSYEIAIRYVNVRTPGIGFEGNDPDDWDSEFAPDGKRTVVTWSGEPTWNTAPSFVNSSTPLLLSWTNSQTNAPYLLEKSTNAGADWTTVASDLFATSYSYPPVTGELGSDVLFRVRVQRGAIAGPSAGQITVAMYITVGATAFTSAQFFPATRIATLAWSAATLALNYLLEKSTDGGATYSTVGVISGLTTNYFPPEAEINTTVRFRVRGKNGTTYGAPATVDLAMTLVVGATVLSAGAFSQAQGSQALTWTAATNATSYLLEKNAGAGWVSVTTTSYPAYTYEAPLGEANATVSFRVTPKNGSVSGAVSNVVAPTFTVVLITPTGVAGAATLVGPPTWTGTGTWDAQAGLSGITMYVAIRGTVSPGPPSPGEYIGSDLSGAAVSSQVYYIASGSPLGPDWRAYFYLVAKTWRGLIESAPTGVTMIQISAP